MKRYSIYVILILVVGSICSSCYEDRSTLPDMSVPEIVIDVSGIPENLMVGYLEPFTVAPTITKNGVDGSNLELLYEWRINKVINTTTTDTVISTDRIFNGIINNPISGTPYVLRYKVTDPATGISKVCFWRIMVVSSFREGLLVSESKDGVSSDFSLIMNNDVTANWSGESKVIRNILETSGQGSYPGLMDRLCYYRYGGQTNYLVAFNRNNQMIRFATVDFSMENTSQLFVYFSSNLNTYNIEKANQELFVTTSEGVMISNPLIALKFTGVAHISKTVSVVNNNVVAVDTWINHRIPAAIWYDKLQGRFYWFYSTGLSPSYAPFPNNPGESFNAGSFPGKTAIAGGLTYDGNTLAMLMKDDPTGNYEICTFYKDPTGFNPGAQSLIAIPAAGKSLLDGALGYVFAKQQPVLYVVKRDGIYAITFGVNPASVATVAKFAAPAGEQILLARLFEQGRYKLDFDDYKPDPYNPNKLVLTELPLNEKALIVATSGASGGKVYVLPMINLGTGNLNTNNKLMYDGFGQILDVLNLGY